MDTFSGEHDEMSTRSVVVLCLTIGILVGVILDMYVRVDNRSRMTGLQTELDVAQESVQTERLARRVFADGMSACYERLGQREKAK